MKCFRMFCSSHVLILVRLLLNSLNDWADGAISHATFAARNVARNEHCVVLKFGGMLHHMFGSF